MKPGIHPGYNEIRVQCACGHIFQTRSTHRGDIHVVIAVEVACGEAHLAPRARKTQVPGARSGIVILGDEHVPGSDHDELHSLAPMSC